MLFLASLLLCAQLLLRHIELVICQQLLPHPHPHIRPPIGAGERSSQLEAAACVGTPEQRRGGSGGRGGGAASDGDGRSPSMHCRSTAATILKCSVAARAAVSGGGGRGVCWCVCVRVCVCVIFSELAAPVPAFGVHAPLRAPESSPSPRRSRRGTPATPERTPGWSHTHRTHAHQHQCCPPAASDIRVQRWSTTNIIIDKLSLRKRLRVGNASRHLGCA